MISNPTPLWRAFGCAILFLGASNAGAAIVSTIDTFANGAQSIGFPSTTGTATGSASSTGSGATIIGDERELTYTVTTNPFSAVGTEGNANIDTIRNEFEVNTDSGVTSTARLHYDGIASNGLGGIDLRTSGANAITLEIIDLDIQVSIDVTVTDILGNVGSFTHSNLQDTGSLNTVHFFYDDFSNATNIDFTSVDVLSVDMNVSDGTDFVLRLVGTSSVQPVPEPSSGFLLLAAFAPVLLRRRR